MRRPCNVAVCPNVTHARGLCSRHYYHARAGRRDVAALLEPAWQNSIGTVCMCTPTPQRQTCGPLFADALQCARCGRPPLDEVVR